MIARVEGVLAEKTPTRVVVDVQGVGYELYVPLGTYTELPDEGKTVRLYVHTHVREDLLQLYGFASARERAIFELLIRANGVGPKLAQTILSGIAPDELVDAIRGGKVAVLRGVPGLGAKKAERLVVELRDRVELLGGEGEGRPGAPSAAPVDDAAEQTLSALLNLGYPRPQAEKVVAAAAEEAGPDAGVEALVRSALRRLSR